MVFDGSGFRSDAASAYEFEEIAVSAYSFFCLAVSAYSVFLLEDATISASSFFGAASVHVKPKMQRPPLILSLFSGFVVVTRKSYSSIFHVARMPAAPQRVSPRAAPSSGRDPPCRRRRARSDAPALCCARVRLAGCAVSSTTDIC